MKDFSQKSLPDRLEDLKELVYLFPNILKSHAFKKYITPSEPVCISKAPYTKIKDVTTIQSPYSNNSPEIGTPNQTWDYQRSPRSINDSGSPLFQGMPDLEE